MEQIGLDGSATLLAMSTQTIPEYLEEERLKAADTQLRTEAEAARILPLQHGHHRASKPTSKRSSKSSGLELAAPVEATTRKKQKRKTVAVSQKKQRVAVKKATKTRKRA